MRPSMPGVSRRSFLITSAGLGGGVVFGFQPALDTTAAFDQNLEVTAWVVVHPDNTVTIRIARSEMGQGSFTGLAMLVAEELECDWEQVRGEYVAPHENLRRSRVWGDMTTGASQSIRASQDYLRRAGAIARDLLIAAAAKTWNVPMAECIALRSTVTHVPTGRVSTFAALAHAAAQLRPPREVRLKEPRDWTIVGTPRRQLGSADMVIGRCLYGADVQLPNMLHAAIMQCPVFGGTLQSVETISAKAIKGVRQVIKLPTAVAVVADSWWQAKKGADALRPIWAHDKAEVPSSEGIAQLLREGLDAADAEIGREEGNVNEAFAHASKIISADYAVPFLAHATMEPQTCAAHITSDGVEIWVPTQNGEQSLVTAAAVAGVARERVTVHKMMLGGGFGRRGITQDFVEQAVAIAKQVSQPVKLMWSREQDMQHDFYRPSCMARQSAALDGQGNPIAWKVRVVGPSVMASNYPALVAGLADLELLQGLLDEVPYSIPNWFVDCVVRNTRVPVGLWRGVNHTQNAFFKECFVDEMAHASGQDPYLFRRKLLSHADRSLAVLDAAADAARWGSLGGSDRFQGIAIHECCGTICSQVAELSVTTSGKLQIHRIISAIDSGFVVNPLSVERQTEGAVAFALSAALYEEIAIKDGSVQQSNFHNYEVLRIAEMPPVETILVPSGVGWGGVGEPPVPPLAAALCNAIFAATGQRIRSLPLKRHSLQGAESR